MKKLIATAAAAVIALSACSSDSGAGATESLTTPNADGVIEVRVGASPTPHAEILDYLESSGLAADAGIKIVVTEFTDYVLPNETLEKGDIDANYFQHIPFLENANKEGGYNLVPAAIGIISVPRPQLSI